MPFKQDYLAAEQVTLETYVHRNTAINRIRRLYESAGIVVRRGIRLDDASADCLWTRFFEPFRESLQQLPDIRANYDQYLLQQICVLASLVRELDLLQQGQLGDIGIAQKMSNLFVKDHWALNAFLPQTDLVLHLPLDQRILSKLRHRPTTWRAWTRADNTAETRRDYQRIQDRFRVEYERIRIFRSPLEMEQFIWYRIPNT